MRRGSLDEIVIFANVLWFEASANTMPCCQFERHLCGFCRSSEDPCGDVIELIKREFSGLGVGDGHGFVRVRCVGVGCVGGE